MARRFHHEEEEIDDSDLNLTPYLDIITTLVIFMIFTFQVVIEFRMIDVFAPAMVAGDGGAAAEQKLAVTLVITKTGHYLAASDGSFQAVPKAGDGKYDFVELKRQLIRWKEDFQLEEGITVTPEADIEYAVVVETMDNIRRYEKGWLFPDVVLGKAAEAQP